MTTATIISATGRCREAVATATIIPDGSGKITVNGRTFDEYFNTLAQRSTALRPLLITEKNKAVDVDVKAHGGGSQGQAGATSLAISRALIKMEPELRPVLKKKGLLRRDPRMKERKKSGQPGARKRFQFSKR